jgi:hypothetical protein
MEQTDKGKKTYLTGRIFVILLLAFVGFVIIRFSTSLVLLHLRDLRPVVFTVLTRPAMVVKYYPKQNKIHAAVISEKYADERTDKQSVIDAKNVLLRYNSQFSAAGKFFAPDKEIPAGDFWHNTKKYLKNWRENPYLVYEYFQNYRKAVRQKRCNLSVYEFIALSLRLSQLKPSDILIAFDQKGEDKYLFSDLKPVSAPVLVKVLNASGIKGLARHATDYLRILNGKGIVRVDVISYGNWNKQLEKSRIETVDARSFLELCELAKKLGLFSTEIIFERKKRSFADATLILAADVTLPETGDWKAGEMLH